MPFLSFFIDENDLSLLLDRLNADPEIAFIVPDGLRENEKVYQPPSSAFPVQIRGGKLEGVMGHLRRPWKAARTVATLADGLHSLWHVPAGPLPLISIERDDRPIPLIGPQSPPLDPPIPDPWTGWTGTDQFGPGCLPWIRLDLWTRHQPYTQEERSTLHELNSFWDSTDDMLVVSGFQWTGNYFRPALRQTHRWWNRMKGWVDRNAVRLPTHAGFNFWAFPSALQKLKGGMRYYSHNWDLDEAIRDSPLLSRLRSSSS